MTVVISDELVLSQVSEVDPDNPLIGWDNLVTVANISTGRYPDGASVEDTNFPTINMANPSTYLRFQQVNPGESLFIQVDLLGTQQVDYIAVAGHNFGSGARTLQVFGATTVDALGEPVFSSITQEQILGDDTPALFRFALAPYIAIQLVVTALSGASDAAFAAVVFVGKLLVIERKIQLTFTPLPYGRNSDITSNRAEKGQFIGRIIVGSWVETTANFMYISSDFYRDEMDPFVEASETRTFFFAWAPVSYPREVGYAWTMRTPQPVIHQILEDGDHLIQLQLEMQGITA